MDLKGVPNLYKNVEERCYSSKAKLAQDIQVLCNEGIVFFTITDGSCLMRPEIKVLSNCTIFVKCLFYTGEIKSFKITYEEVIYEGLNFG